MKLFGFSFIGLSLIVGLILIAAVLLTYNWRNTISDGTDLAGTKVGYFFEWASGNWNADARPKIGNFWFSIFAIGAVVLSLGNYLAIGTAILWGWRVSRKTGQVESLMELVDVLPARDKSIRAKLRSLLMKAQNNPQVANFLETAFDDGILEKAFEEGDKDWNEVLPDMFGSEVKEKYRAALRTKIGQHAANTSPKLG